MELFDYPKVVDIPEVGDVIECIEFANGLDEVDVPYQTTIGRRKAVRVTSAVSDRHELVDRSRSGARFVVEFVQGHEEENFRATARMTVVVASQLTPEGEYQPDATRVLFVRWDAFTEKNPWRPGGPDVRFLNDALNRSATIRLVGRMTPQLTFK